MVKRIGEIVHQGGLLSPLPHIIQIDIALFSDMFGALVVILIRSGTTFPFYLRLWGYDPALLLTEAYNLIGSHLKAVLTIGQNPLVNRIAKIPRYFIQLKSVLHRIITFCSFPFKPDSITECG